MTDTCLGPTRVQRVHGEPLPPGAIYVGSGSRLANPFVVRRHGMRWRVVDFGDRSRSLREDPEIVSRFVDAAAMATTLFRLYTGPGGLYEPEFRDLTELAGRNLACWCPLEDEYGRSFPCHANLLLARTSGRQA